MASIGVTTLENKAERFPLANAADLKIAKVDPVTGALAGTGNYEDISIKYFNQAYARTGLVISPLNFGIVIDAGTHTMVDCGTNATTPHITSANYTTSDLTLADFAAGTVTIMEGADAGVHTISGTPVDNAGTLEITLTAGLTGGGTNISVSMQRATPIVATAEEIYERVQYLLRQGSNINSNLTSGEEVFGDSADELLTFVGDTLVAGSVTSPPNNPNFAGGDGVFIEGFDSNDTNRIKFVNNSLDTAAEQAFPFVSAGTINFNPNLVNDTGPAEYWMFFTYTHRSTSTTTITPTAGAAATIVTAAAGMPALTVGEYLALGNCVNTVNNGVWIVDTVTTSEENYTCTKVSGDTPLSETSSPSVTIDGNPINSPPASRTALALVLRWRLVPSGRVTV